MKSYRRLRRLEPDAELIRRRAAGETFRKLCGDYGVSHTTLSRYFARPEIAKQVKWARRLKRERDRAAELRWTARRQADREARHREKQQLAADRQGAADGAPATADDSNGSSSGHAHSSTGASGRGRLIRTNGPGSDYANWLDRRDARVPPTRADLRSLNDDRAAGVVAAGGGIQEVIEATGLRTLENVVALIDPEILERAYENDAGLPPDS